jgi:response regulator RpfG family c-di-GMP phosphodiesterase
LALLADDPSISLVISDYRILRDNGVDFMREIHHNWPGRGRILLTSYANRLEVKQALVDGTIQRLFKKPWVDKELLTCVAHWLGAPAKGTLFQLST